jgi:hypothetical protein
MKAGVELMSVLEFIHDELEYRELIAEFFDRDGWIHVAYLRNGPNSRELKLKDSTHNYETVTIDCLKRMYKRK